MNLVLFDGVIGREREDGEILKRKFERHQSFVKLRHEPSPDVVRRVVDQKRHHLEFLLIRWKWEGIGRGKEGMGGGGFSEMREGRGGE